MPQPNILLVDDDDGVRDSLARALQTEGFRVTGVAEASGVLESVATEKPSLVLLDLGLGDESGWDLFEVISRQHPLIPIVIITARSGQFEVARLAGVGAFVEKPIEIPHLVTIMRRLLAEDANTRLRRLAKRTPSTKFVPGATRRRFFPRPRQ